MSNGERVEDDDGEIPSDWVSRISWGRTDTEGTKAPTCVGALEGANNRSFPIRSVSGSDRVTFTGK